MTTKVGWTSLLSEEYTWLLARIANAKFPNRNGEPFSETWKSFLRLIFVPRFRKLLKAKKQGSGRITIDGARFLKVSSSRLLFSTYGIVCLCDGTQTGYSMDYD